MKTHLDISHTGTLQREGTRMEFDQKSTAFIMGILTDLYSDPAMACIREYSTNALDSHVEAGNPDPIRVYLPTSLRPLFVVQDFGVGMSKYTIEEVYSKYGASTKRDTDLQVGMLGMGCKSALSYTTQFTLLSRFNGVQYTVLITREDDGGGSVNIIDEQITEEPNGVQVMIPVKNSSDFTAKCRQFFQYWEPGKVLVNDETVPSIWSNLAPGWTMIDPDVAINTANQYGNVSYIVMGNVPYKIDNSKYPIFEKFSCVARVEIGTVNFVPSREALNDSKRTVEAVEMLGEVVSNQIIQGIQTDIDNQPSYMAAYNTKIKWRRVMEGLKIENHIWRYKGLRFPEAWQFKDPVPLGIDARRTGSMSNRYEKLSFDQIRGFEYFITGFNGTFISRSTKERLSSYLHDRGQYGNRVLFCSDPSLINSPWTQEIPRIPFSVVQAVKLDRDHVTKVKHALRLIDLYGQENLTDELPEDGKIVAWIPALQEKPILLANRIGGILKNHEYVAVVLAADRKKFTRAFPTVPLYRDYIVMAALELVNGMSAVDTWKMYSLGADNRGSWSSVLPQLEEANEIRDPELRAMTLKYSDHELSTGVEAQYTRLIALFEHYDMPPVLVSKNDDFDKIVAIKERYHPIIRLASGSSYYRAELIELYNALHIVYNDLHLIPATY